MNLELGGGCQVSEGGAEVLRKSISQAVKTWEWEWELGGKSGNGAILSCAVGGTQYQEYSGLCHLASISEWESTS